MTNEQELLARAMGHIDGDMIRSAHGPRKKVRRIIPVAVAACLIAAFAAVFPTLREVIDTHSPILNPEDGPVDVENIGKPEMNPCAEIGMPVTLGGTTLTLTAVTDTTATFEMIKTDDTPVYALLYDLREGALASTEPDYKDNGVLIRPKTIRVFVNGAEQPVFQLPTAAGSYTVLVEFSSIRNGTYPMREYIGVYAYIGEKDTAVTERFSLTIKESATESESSSDTAQGN
jgi:hypothetical protein